MLASCARATWCDARKDTHLETARPSHVPIRFHQRRHVAVQWVSGCAREVMRRGTRGHGSRLLAFFVPLGTTEQ